MRRQSNAAVEQVGVNLGDRGIDAMIKLLETRWRVVLVLMAGEGIDFSKRPQNISRMKTRLSMLKETLISGKMLPALKDVGFEDDDIPHLQQEIKQLVDACYAAYTWKGEGCGLMKLAQRFVDSASSATQDGGAAKATEKSKLQEMAKEVIKKAFGQDIASDSVSAIRLDSDSESDSE